MCSLDRNREKNWADQWFSFHVQMWDRNISKVLPAENRKNWAFSTASDETENTLVLSGKNVLEFVVRDVKSVVLEGNEQDARVLTSGVVHERNTNTSEVVLFGIMYQPFGILASRHNRMGPLNSHTWECS